MFNRFKELLSEIVLYLTERKLIDEFSQIKSPEWQCEMFFLCDITNHLNELNLKLQGKDKFIWDQARIVTEFTLKLITFLAQFKEKDFTFFPILQSKQEDIDDTFHFEQFIEKLIEEFDRDFKNSKNLLWHFSLSKIHSFLIKVNRKNYPKFST